jgi:hypothetical protein
MEAVRTSPQDSTKKEIEATEIGGEIAYACVKWTRIPHELSRRGDVFWAWYFPGGGRLLAHDSPDRVSDKSYVRWFRMSSRIKRVHHF